MHPLARSFGSFTLIKMFAIAALFVGIGFSHATHADTPDPNPSHTVSIDMPPATVTASVTSEPSAFDPFANGMDGDALAAFVSLTFKAAASGNWGALIVLLLILTVSAVRRWGGSRWPFLKTDAGSAMLVLSLGVLGALGHALAAGAAVSWPLIATGLAIGFAAAGGFATAVRILPWVIAKLPAPLAPVLGPVLRAVLSIMGSSPATVEARAKAAGAAAVSASPGTGVSGILSK